MSIVDQLEDRQNEGENPLPFEEGESRSAQIFRSSMIGIGVNALLVAIKLIIGSLTHSVAIVSDGINNLADTLGGILTIIGAKLSMRRPNKKHPYGYGRTEYIITVIVAALILFSGANAMNESIEHVIHPVETTYTTPMIAVLFIAMIGRCLIGLYLQKRGRALGADSMVASGTDALLDSIVTAATIVSAIITIFFGVSTEAYLAIIISALILKAGIEILLNALSKILGQRADEDVSSQVKEAVEGIPGVLRATKLRLVDYGPENIRGSIYIEVDESLALNEVDQIASAAKIQAYLASRVRLDAVGIQPVNTGDKEINDLRDKVEEMVLENEHVLEMHGFRVNTETNTVALEVVVDFGKFDHEALADHLAEQAMKQCKGYTFIITTESSITG